MQVAVSNEGISWHFNPPSSSNFGGMWESGVKSVESHFSRVVGEQVLTHEELQTIYVQIEAVLNSHPLTPVSSDPNDSSVLTPGHFLTMEPSIAPPGPDPIGIPSHKRSNWTADSIPIQKDTLVLIKTENAPPLHWPMGRVVDVSPGADGKV
ncbi:hypothetical protein JTB14_002360 [Gonioctena quinquepunctata]|nr:hypothetical protein JTB14_002360 [Gonioctena quinquepunctata]